MFVNIACRIRDGGRCAAAIPPPSGLLRSAGVVLLAAMILLTGRTSSCGFEHAGIEEFADLPLHELVNIRVSSVLKREQDISDAPAAVTVLTNEEIRRSGATSIPDALRLVPGVHVATVNASGWAVSSRGFNDLYANKLLVQVDGRAVYNPLFSGVFWDLQQPMLEDLDRIEVIRGPGATLWGANAVNGVVNIVSREAGETQGLAVTAGGGDVHQVMNGIRYGGRLSETAHYRVFTRFQLTDDFPLADGDPAGDRWHAWHGGFRMDSRPDPDTHVMWASDATTLDLMDGASSAYNVNTVGRWRRDLFDRSHVEVQTFYDRIQRDEAFAGRIAIDTVDGAVDHGFGLGDRNDVLWGAGYRFSTVEVDGGTTIEPRNGQMDLHLFHAFAQNELHVVPDRLTLTGGTKVEHNSFTGFEVQPGVRGLFKPTESQSIWTAVSRAVRTPSVGEGSNTYAFVIPEDPPVTPFETKFAGNPELRSEVLWAYELGYRVQPTERVAFDVAGFYNDYDRLVQVHFGEGEFDPGPPMSAEFPYHNALTGETYGGEAVLTVAPEDRWRVSASYSLLRAHLRGPEETDPAYHADSSPRHMGTLRSSLDLTSATLLDKQLRYMDKTGFAPSYLTADVRLAHRPGDNIEMSLVGQNLFGSQHQEREWDFVGVTSEVPRGFYARVSWGF